MSFHVKKKVKVIGMDNPRFRVITVEEPSSLAAEAYRRIKVGVEYSEVDHKIQVIQFVSAAQGEAKTTTLLNVAASYAEDGKKVLVVDLDFRRPKLHRAFNVEDKDGITDVLAGKMSLADAIHHSDKLGFDCLPRGSKVAYPTAIVASKEMKSLFGKLRESYDIILVDNPPVLAVSDCISIAPLTDGAIFLVHKKATDKNAAKDAVKMLRQNGFNIIGVVFAGLTKQDRGYGYSSSYYYKYYGGYGYTQAGMEASQKEHSQTK